MHPLLRISVRLTTIFIIVFFAIQPFNWFCSITQKCNTIYLSSFIPKREGIDNIKLKFEVTNYSQKVDFKVIQKTLTTVSGRKNVVFYRAKNVSKKHIRINPALFVKPKYVEKYLTRYECLCTRQFKIAPGEEIEMRMEFEIKNSISDDVNFQKDPDSPILIRYKI